MFSYENSENFSNWSLYKKTNKEWQTWDSNFMIMEYKDFQRLIRAKKIQVKIGKLYLSTDEYGQPQLKIEQIPMIKR